MYLLTSAESQYCVLTNRLQESDVGPCLLVSSATLKFLIGGSKGGGETWSQEVENGK